MGGGRFSCTPFFSPGSSLLFLFTWMSHSMTSESSNSRTMHLHSALTSLLLLNFNISLPPVTSSFSSCWFDLFIYLFFFLIDWLVDVFVVHQVAHQFPFWRERQKQQSKSQDVGRLKWKKKWNKIEEKENHLNRRFSSISTRRKCRPNFLLLLLLGGITHTHTHTHHTLSHTHTPHTYNGLPFGSSCLLDQFFGGGGSPYDQNCDDSTQKWCSSRG